MAESTDLPKVSKEEIESAENFEREAAEAANEKYGNLKGGPAALSGEMGVAAIDTEKQIIEDKIKFEKLEERALIDEVTGIPNEKSLNPMLDGLENEWERNNIQSGSFIVADLTGLHAANDTYGRNTGGNDYLRSVAEALRESARSGDRFFRMGTSADEFVLHLPNTIGRVGVNKVIDRIDHALYQQQEMLQQKYPGIKFELSYGISDYEPGISPKTAFEEATALLKDAKESKTKGERTGTVGRVFADHKKSE